MTTFSNQTIVITGASRGIGAATAHHFASLQATVVLAARHEAQISKTAEDIQAAGGEAKALVCDVSRASEMKALCDETIALTGRLDVLVNNAGVIDPIARLADSDPQAWGQMIDVNLKGVYHGLRFAIPHMLAQGGGTIVNLSSGAATSALEGWSHYCASKAGVLSLTRVADKEYRDRGIRVVGLSPGTVATDMQVKIKASGINPVSKLEPSSHIPSDWVARAIAWLAGPGGDNHLGTDFSIKTAEGRRAVGLSAAE